jgi:Tfp pilus assembly protein PilP
MRNKIILLLMMGLLCMVTHPLLSQGQEQTTAQETETQIIQTRGPTYDPGDRRDPFRNLLVGQEAGEKGLERGIQNISIDNVVLIGIAKSKGVINAIINDSQGYPYFIKKGDTFEDGFVLSVDDSRVVFRKTQERGIPLMKPKDIVKEIKIEEP